MSENQGSSISGGSGSGDQWTKTYTIVLIIFGVIAVIGSYAYEHYTFNTVTFEFVKSLLVPLFIIAVFLERAQEVFVSAAREHERSPKDTRLKEARDRLKEARNDLNTRRAEAQKKIDDAREALRKATDDTADKIREQVDKLIEDRDSITDCKEIEDREKDVKTASEEVSEFKAKTKRISFLFGLGAGLAIAIAGVRVLKPFVNWDADPVGTQMAMFEFVDIVLTGAMIGGGSDGIHKIMNVITEFLDTASTLNKKRREDAGEK